VTIFWVADRLNELVLQEEMTSWPEEAVVLHAKAFGCIRYLLYGVTAEWRSVPCALGHGRGRNGLGWGARDMREARAC
jgi:hypothetical protein